MATPPGREIIRRQVQCLILDLLSDADMEEEMRLGLLRHISEHPGNPEAALLAHLNDCEDRPRE